MKKPSPWKRETLRAAEYRFTFKPPEGGRWTRIDIQSYEPFSNSSKRCWRIDFQRADHFAEVKISGLGSADEARLVAEKINSFIGGKEWPPR